MIKDKYEKYIFPSLAGAQRIQKTEHIRYQLLDHLRGIGKDRKYFIKTYGCQGNLADSRKWPACWKRWISGPRKKRARPMS